MRQELHALGSVLVLSYFFSKDLKKSASIFWLQADFLRSVLPDNLNEKSPTNDKNSPKKSPFTFYCIFDTFRES